jgi:hypothetical protein
MYVTKVNVLVPSFFIPKLDGEGVSLMLVGKDDNERLFR